MSGTQLINGVLSITTMALVASNIYLYTELSSLNASKVQHPSGNLSQHDVISLVDDRLASLEKRKAQALKTSH